ncbi:MAG: hypothetical protein AB1589_46295, partial [Cyanobacteriota bacterium]
SFEVDGSQSSFNHELQYQLDYGDGNQSNWSQSPINVVFANMGTYQIKARARCADHNEVVSQWSAAAQITISGLKLTIIIDPAQAGTVSVDPEKDEYNYLELVQLHAMANDESSIFKYWGGVGGAETQNPISLRVHRNREITAYFDVETITVPVFLIGPNNGSTGETLTFQTGGAVSNLGHDVEYQFDWGDGTLSEWGDSTKSYTYTSYGTKQVRSRARCQDHNQIISDWSEVLTVIISDFTLEVSIEPEGKGQVSKIPDKTKYAEGEQVLLTAEAVQFYQFDHWSGDLTGNENPITISMNSSKSVMAHFIKTSEVVTKPTFLTGPDTGIMGKSLPFS